MYLRKNVLVGKKDLLVQKSNVSIKHHFKVLSARTYARLQSWLSLIDDFVGI